MSKLKSIPIDEVTTAIKNASNFAQVCKALECVDNSNNRQYLQDIVKKHVEIAHIRAVADFSDEDLLSEINHPDNLVGLCPNHHWEYDNGLLNL